jgi:hypothetical protein
MRPTQNQPRGASKTWACRATPTKPAISRRLILRKAGRALGEGKKVTVLLQKGWVPVSIACISTMAGPPPSLNLSDMQPGDEVTVMENPQINPNRNEGMRIAKRQELTDNLERVGQRRPPAVGFRKRTRPQDQLS